MGSWVLGAFAALVGVVPPLRAIAGSAALDTVAGPDGYLPLGLLDALGEGPREVDLAGRARDGWLAQDADLGAVFVARDAGRVRVFSSICPHLGCAVDWDPAGRRFLCPCHGSIFGADGRVLGGPSPRSLDELPARVSTAGEISCRWLRFAPGTPKREVL